MHMQMHREYGADPVKAVVQAERMIVEVMRERGFPHRHRDALAAAARVMDDKVPAIDYYELQAHLEEELHLESGAVSIVQSVSPLERDSSDTGKGRQLYLQVSPALAPLARALLTKINRALPPSVNLQLLAGGATAQVRTGRLARVTGLFDLRLHKAFGTSRLTGWNNLDATPDSVLSIAEDATLKALGPNLRVMFDEVLVHKANALANAAPAGPAEEHYVKGVVLEPGVVDKTRTRLPDGSFTEGDTYDKEVVRAACYYYMEHGGFGARLHTKLGGTELGPADTCLLENYLTDPGAKIAGRAVTEGTWVQAWRIYSESLWSDIKAKKLNAFSIGAMVGGVVEEV
jgi:hypothetical protein